MNQYQQNFQNEVAKAKANRYEVQLFEQIKGLSLPIPEKEYRFHRERRWRFDFAWPEQKIAVEVEGGIYHGFSRHTSIKGFTGDCEKYNEAALAGWKVLRFTPRMVLDSVAIQCVQRAFVRAA